MCSEGYCSCRVCLSLCVSVKSHLTSGDSACRENAATYSADNEGQMFSLKLPHCRDRALPPLDGHTYDRSFFLLEALSLSDPGLLLIHLQEELFQFQTLLYRME